MSDPVTHVSPCPACAMPAAWTCAQGVRTYPEDGPFVDQPSTFTIDCAHCDREESAA
jgi:hypothetical protein